MRYCRRSRVTRCSLAPWPSHRMARRWHRQRTTRQSNCGTSAQTRRCRHLTLTVINHLSFSNDGTFLQTDREPLYGTFLSSNAALSGPSLPLSIFVGEHWVSRNGERLLWLPSDHRSRHVAIQDDIVVFGYNSSRVLVMEFAFWNIP